MASFYLNNNPLIASPGHLVIEHALEQATRVLEQAEEDELPEIQMATGPGNISKSIFELSVNSKFVKGLRKQRWRRKG